MASRGPPAMFSVPSATAFRLKSLSTYLEGEIMPRTLLALILAAFMLAATSCATAPPVLPEHVKWVEPPTLPGAKLAVLDGDPSKPGPSTYRISFPANYRIPAHYHPVTEAVTVISGNIYLGHGDKPDSTKGTKYPAGSFATVPANMRHYGWTTEEAVVQISITGPTGMTFVNPADDPRKK